METKPEIYLCRHGGTSWTETGQHTGTTDLPLTEAGRQQALCLSRRLKKIRFNLILTSPLQRASETCQLAGLNGAIKEPDAVEWNYGQYEGLTAEEIGKKQPSWNLFVNGAPAGETPVQVADRADRLIKKLLEPKGNVVLFSHGHFLRMLAARWLGLKPLDGRLFFLSTASLSVLGFERKQPVIKLWNDTDFLTK